MRRDQNLCKILNEENYRIQSKRRTTRMIFEGKRRLKYFISRQVGVTPARTHSISGLKLYFPH